MALFSRKPKPPAVNVGDPRFDSWETVAEFEDLATATAFAGRLRELDIPNALTADWELDEHGRGEIYLQVPGEHYDGATVAIEGYDL